MAKMIFVEEDHNLNAIKNIADGAAAQDAVAFHQLADAIAGTASPLTAGLGIDITNDVVSVKRDPLSGLSLDNAGLSVDVADGIGKSANNGALYVNIGYGLYFAGQNDDFVTVKTHPTGGIVLGADGLAVNTGTAIEKDSEGGLSVIVGDGNHVVNDSVTVNPKSGGHVGVDIAGVFVDVATLVRDPVFVSGVGETQQIDPNGGLLNDSGATRREWAVKKQQAGALRSDANGMYVLHKTSGHTGSDNAGLFVNVTSLLGDPAFIAGIGNIASSGAFQVGGEPDGQWNSPVPGAVSPLRPTLYFRGRTVSVGDDATNNQTIIDVIDEVPAGGVSGQVLTKSANADYATTWADSKATTITGVPPVGVVDDGDGGFVIGVSTGPGVSTATGKLEANVFADGGLTKTAGASADGLAILAAPGEGITVGPGGIEVDWTVVPPPTGPTDAVTKEYVDQVAQGMIPLQAVRVATTGPVDLSTVTTVDGVALAPGDRLLVKDQADPIGNGVFVKDPAGATRAPDADDEGELRVGSTVFVAEGATNAQASFAVSSIGDDAGAETRSLWSPGVDPNVWVKSSQITGYVGGDGLDLTGNVFSVNTGDGIAIVADAVRVQPSDGSIGVGASGIRVEVAPRGGLSRTAQGPMVSLDADSGLVVDINGVLRVTGTGAPTVPGATPASPARTVTGTVTALGTGNETLVFTHGLGVPSPAVSVQVNGCEVVADVCRPNNNDVTIGLGLAPAGTTFTVTVTG